MIDYYKLFEEMLAEEGGEEKVSKYLDEVAESANRAIKQKTLEKKKELAVAYIANVIQETYPDLELFKIKGFGPKDLAEMMLDTILALDDMVANYGADEAFTKLFDILR